MPQAPDALLPAPELSAPIGPGNVRREGHSKVTGDALYSVEYQPDQIGATEPILYGAAVLSTIARGRIAAIDTKNAQAMPGVRLVLTADNVPRQSPWGPLNAPVRFARSQPVFFDRTVRYFGEPVAFVVADKFENATAAADLVSVRYEPLDASIVLKESGGINPAPLHGGKSADSRTGNFDEAFAQSPHQIDVRYDTPYQNHAAMELQGSLAHWKDGKLTVYAPAQIPDAMQEGLAATFGLPKDRVRVVARLIGGGFGGKLPYFSDSVACAIASRILKQPVKFSFTRQQMFTATTHRPAVLHHVRIGVGADGHIRALAHDVVSQTASFDNYLDGDTMGAKGLYRADAIRTTQRIARLDLPRSDSMRSPGDASGTLALESGIDEAARLCGLDPVEFRLRNDTQINPSTGQPFSSRHLAECLRQGAEKFGWSTRRKRREGEWLIGYGVAAAMRDNMLRPSSAEVTLAPDGALVARLAMTDPGTGSITVLSQIASEAMGIPLDRVTVLIGDTDFPPTAGSGGSFGAESAGSALYEACVALRGALQSKAEVAAGTHLHFADGALIAGDHRYPLGRLVGAAGLTVQGHTAPGMEAKRYAEATFGAHFVEVAVSAVTGETRCRTMLGAFAAGRILNARTARSQALGGMIWGLSSALIEGNVVDPRGQFVMRDLANYHVPIMADVGAIDVMLLPEIEPVANPIGIKGIGEVGINGAGAAIANAIFDACGVRVRSFPITLDKLLPGLPTLT
jgi:xanthine dehydrogenase YagR molybdenum-binding subunit